MTKKSILAVSFVYIAYLISLFAVGIFCKKNWCELREDGILVSILYGLFPLAIIFFLSLLTYRMREEVFHAWWNFARWMVPIIIVATIVIKLMPSNGGFFNMDALIYLLVLAPLYSIFILTSLWKIFRAYRATKKQNNNPQ